jgi:hypothetical protein
MDVRWENTDVEWVGFYPLTQNIKTKFNWKLFTKVNKRPNKESLGLDRQSVLIKREAHALLI